MVRVRVRVRVTDAVRQEDLDVGVPRGRVACGVSHGHHVPDDGAAVAVAVDAGRLVHVDVDHLAQRRRPAQAAKGALVEEA